MVFIQFFVHVLCALNFCIPEKKAPEPQLVDNNIEIGFRSFLSDYDLDPNVPPVANTSFGGMLEGIIMKSIKSRNIAAFHGVPYAQPPVGHLRFEPPQPIHWSGIRHAHSMGPSCLQIDPGQFYRVEGHEDCLHMNIYTPKLPKNGSMDEDEKLPVIFYIHGGAFFFGSGNHYGPSYFLDQDVILVTFNYRLGVLGFYSTGDEVVPGNNGMKDQVLALKWVRDNIENFGGDPKRITLMGQSAGAVSSNLHLMSKMSMDIPHAAIMHSGSAHVHWSLVNDTIDNSQKISKWFSCPTNESRLMVDCLKKQNPYLVVYRTLKLHKEYMYPFFQFGPIVEAPGPNAFLEQSPLVAYSKKEVRDIPIIKGIVRDEGDLFAFMLYLWPGILSDLNKKFDKFAPYILDTLEDGLRDNTIYEKILEFYFKKEKMSFYNRHEIGQMLGDRLINGGVYRGLQYHSEIAPTYGYFFDYRGKYSVSSTVGLNKNDWGITHLDDLLYMFNSTFYFDSIKLEDQEYAITEFMINVWANFAHTGKPTFTNDDGDNVDFWRPINNPQKMEILEINKDPKMISFPYQNRVQFWEDLNLSDINPFPKSQTPPPSSTTTSPLLSALYSSSTFKPSPSASASGEEDTTTYSSFSEEETTPYYSSPLSSSNSKLSKDDLHSENEIR